MECDVTQRTQVENLARAAVERFGRIDTWVNDAGMSIYGRLDEVSEEDSRRLFETNFWGVYYGSLVALPHLKANGGALINIGSEVSDAVIGLQGMYSTTKHAVKGFTDALRVEIQEMDKAPVSITLIQPTATDTPFPQHARNYMDQEPKLPTPLDDPEDVAEAILKAAVKPTRSKKVGALSKINTATAKLAPGLGEKMTPMQLTVNNTMKLLAMRKERSIAPVKQPAWQVKRAEQVDSKTVKQRNDYSWPGLTKTKTIRPHTRSSLMTSPWTSVSRRSVPL